MFDALYLSPHFDDAVLSCGAQIWDRVQAGQRVGTVTVCAAPAPAELSPFAQSLHVRWSQLGTFDRAEEDRQALKQLGAEPLHLPYGDCIYRRSPAGAWLYASEAAIFGEVSQAEDYLLDELASTFEKLALTAKAEMWIPQAIGNHVDHQLVRQAGERWASRSGRSVRHYADYPYAETVEGGRVVTVSQAGLEAKIEAVLAYKSQLSTFWSDENTVRATVGGWAERMF